MGLVRGQVAPIPGVGLVVPIPIGRVRFQGGVGANTRGRGGVGKEGWLA